MEDLPTDLTIEPKDGASVIARLGKLDRSHVDISCNQT
jgi:hypothetical protein